MIDGADGSVGAVKETVAVASVVPAVTVQVRVPASARLTVSV